MVTFKHFYLLSLLRRTQYIRIYLLNAVYKAVDFRCTLAYCVKSTRMTSQLFMENLEYLEYLERISRISSIITGDPVVK